VLDAAASGASQAVSLVLNIIANLIAFVSFVAFLDSVVAWLALQVGFDYINFTWIIGKIFMPLAWTMGVPWEDCDVVGELVGIKTIVNEFVAYSRLREFEGQIKPKSKLIATYALCGFSNISGIGIQIGGIGALIPERKSELSSIAVRALFAGSMACFLTACIAGLLIEQ
jgi:pyrimidine nucleoside transport protein